MSTLTVSVSKRGLHSSSSAIFARLMWPPLPGYAADPDAIESFAKVMSNCAGQVNILGFSRPFEETLCTAASEFLLAVQE